MPTRTESFTFNQKRNEIMPQFAKMLINRTPVTRTCEALDISPLTYYRKLEWLYRRCLEFLERHEQKPLNSMQFDSLWLNTDKLLYYLNNVRQKGHGGLRYDNLEDKQLQTHIIVTGDVDTGYIFRSDIAYDWDVNLKSVNDDTLYYREDHLHEFSKKNARLRFSHSPQPPTKNDSQTMAEYHEYRNEFMRRENYIDGLHVKSSYTVTAHLWLLKQTLQSQKWRFVSDEDETIMNAFYRVFNEEFISNEALHFLAKVERDKDLPDAYQEHIQAKKHLKDWAEWNGIKERSIWKIASIKLAMELKKHSFHKELSNGSISYKVWVKNPIEHPLPPTDKGFFTVDCTSDLSGFDDEYIANMILKVSDRPTNNFM
ncbi:hypothetical protein [Bacillus pseudomycoides]|uniref:hypothetical protein n=1 Tax=Bacillus pseudomycoides TaxID=64104 RepID=UPI001FB44A0F|nr:hypothetical protein [Bacillus pseudomycoides]